MLIAENIHKGYKREPVLRGVSFSMRPATILGICGSNGAGKTTLIHILASILPADSGQITLMGVPVSQARRYRAMIGFVPQHIALAANLTVRQNLVFWASLRGLNGQPLKTAVDAAAEMANVTAFLNKPRGRCSGGMAKRANLAAGLVGFPGLILLDEPTAGIDEENRDLILRTLTDLRRQGCMVLMVNHYLQEMAQVCDRIITLRDGVIAEADAHDR
ncbi:MAG: ABC transporter ATP-binding protein [Clostridiaceae bacterium]|nr:ABC transporter ATP-binding protein [Clostridiaceae bacterium]